MLFHDLYLLSLPVTIANLPLFADVLLLSLVIAHQNPYFSSKFIQTSFTVGNGGMACQSRSNGT